MQCNVYRKYLNIEQGANGDIVNPSSRLHIIGWLKFASYGYVTITPCTGDWPILGTHIHCAVRVLYNVTPTVARDFHLWIYILPVTFRPVTEHLTLSLPVSISVATGIRTRTSRMSYNWATSMVLIVKPTACKRQISKLWNCYLKKTLQS